MQLTINPFANCVMALNHGNRKHRFKLNRSPLTSQMFFPCNLIRPYGNFKQLLCKIACTIDHTNNHILTQKHIAHKTSTLPHNHQQTIWFFACKHIQASITQLNKSNC